MIRRPPRSTRTDTLFPYTTLFRSVRVVVHKVLGATSLDEKLVDADRPKRPPLSRTMGDVAYWLGLLLFLPAIVGTLHIDALTAPLSNMISGMLGMLPNLIAAAVIGEIGRAHV